MVENANSNFKNHFSGFKVLVVILKTKKINALKKKLVMPLAKNINNIWKIVEGGVITILFRQKKFLSFFIALTDIFFFLTLINIFVVKRFIFDLAAQICLLSESVKSFRSDQ